MLALENPQFALTLTRAVWLLWRLLVLLLFFLFAEVVRFQKTNNRKLCVFYRLENFSLFLLLNTHRSKRITTHGIFSKPKSKQNKTQNFWSMIMKVTRNEKHTTSHHTITNTDTSYRERKTEKRPQQCNINKCTELSRRRRKRQKSAHEDVVNSMCIHSSIGIRRTHTQTRAKLANVSIHSTRFPFGTSQMQSIINYNTSTLERRADFFCCRQNWRLSQFMYTINSLRLDNWQFNLKTRTNQCDVCTNMARVRQVIKCHMEKMASGWCERRKFWLDNWGRISGLIDLCRWSWFDYRF